MATSEDIVMRKRSLICLRSLKVIDFGTNGKRVYTFLINNNLVIFVAASRVPRDLDSDTGRGCMEATARRGRQSVSVK